ncbi:hypothetical protein MTF65_30040 [Streptomyces sp. APSN-46.1]|uniref:hypothetical protein n=1 Tax=Streptomyces sp. APSN-46.1 TaxID=2929049 RepID=UPI001FB465AA|nr:hypothetical protein [Streptomyces sp. APSN-46.1]MCJ1681523.1 hypothetical protein [Streptomyces sp. APSN-46.1]
MRRKMPVTLGALIVAALLSAGAPASAHTTEAAPRAAAGDLNCRTWVDGYKGFADCTNNTNRAIAFRATIVCGWWPDAVGQWITLNAGQRGTSEGECGGGSGAGSASWQEG